MVDLAVRNKQTEKCGSYENYPCKDLSRWKKNTSIYSIASTVRKWKNTYTNLNESTIRGFKICYEASKKVCRKTKSLNKSLNK